MTSSNLLNSKFVEIQSILFSNFHPIPKTNQTLLTFRIKQLRVVAIHGKILVENFDGFLLNLSHKEKSFFYYFEFYFKITFFFFFSNVLCFFFWKFYFCLIVTLFFFYCLGDYLSSGFSQEFINSFFYLFYSKFCFLLFFRFCYQPSIFFSIFFIFNYSILIGFFLFLLLFSLKKLDKLFSKKIFFFFY